jgi:hypothetical protein
MSILAIIALMLLLGLASEDNGAGCLIVLAIIVMLMATGGM